MAETLRGISWPLELMVTDLVNQGGLKSEDLGIENGRLKYKDLTVGVRYSHQSYLLVSTKENDEEKFKEVVDAFSAVLKYKPMVKYSTARVNPLKSGKEGRPALNIYEWVKEKPSQRLEDLERSRGRGVRDLVRLDLQEQ